MIFNRKDIQLEQFIGTTNNLKKAEKCCDDIIIMINEFNTPSLSVSKMINNTSYVKNLNNLLSDEFGKKIMINFSIRTLTQGGAYTYITSAPIVNFARNKKMLNDTGRLKMNDNSLVPIFINIDYSIIGTGKLNGAELIAIILHEIGHNITTIPIINSMNILTSIFISPIVATGLAYIDIGLSIIEHMPIVNQILRFSNFLNMKILNITGNRSNMLLQLAVIFANKASLIKFINPARHFGGYMGERY